MENKDIIRPRRTGRPPSGISEGGAPERASQYPKITIYFRPAAKTKLEALSTLLGRPAWKILDEAFESYMATIPQEDRVVIEVLTKRKQEKEIEAVTARASAAGAAS